LLIDGQWHDRDEIVEALIPRVAPGKALRRYQAKYEQTRRRYAGSEPKPEKPLDYQIYSGARSIVSEALVNARKHGRAETEERDGVTWIRSAAVCEACGGPLGKKAARRTAAPKPSQPLAIVLRPDPPQWSQQQRAAQ